MDRMYKCLKRVPARPWPVIRCTLKAGLVCIAWTLTGVAFAYHDRALGFGLIFLGFLLFILWFDPKDFYSALDEEPERQIVEAETGRRGQ